MRQVKSYFLNKDYRIDCITSKRVDGVILYSVVVVQYNLPFEPEADWVYNIEDKSEANSIFHRLAKKYKEPLEL